VFLNYSYISTPSISPNNREYTAVTAILFESPKVSSNEKYLGPTNPLIRPWLLTHREKVVSIYTCKFVFFGVVTALSDNSHRAGVSCLKMKHNKFYTFNIYIVSNNRRLKIWKFKFSSYFVIWFSIVSL
jgi:hypothetical protein